MGTRVKGIVRLFRALLVVLAVMLGGCGHLPIQGVVVDDVTGKPIEGAVVNLNGLGPMGMFDSSKRYPTEETVTDAEGRFHLKGTQGRLYLAIYKQGYACWSNHYIFTGKDVQYAVGRYDYDEWEDNYTYRLVPWQEGWSYVRHGMFIGSALGHASPGPKMFEALQWQYGMSSEEKTKRGRM